LKDLLALALDLDLVSLDLVADAPKTLKELALDLAVKVLETLIKVTFLKPYSGRSPQRRDRLREFPEPWNEESWVDWNGDLCFWRTAEMRSKDSPLSRERGVQRGARGPTSSPSWVEEGGYILEGE